MPGILEDIGAFSNPYGIPSQGQWNLTRGIYTNANGSVIFFYESKDGEDPGQRTAVSQITDAGGRRLVFFEYPYRDGQRIADLGRKGETFTFNIKFHGPNYQRKFQEFIDLVVNSNLRGSLVHPVRSSDATLGAITVRPGQYEFVHRHDEWNSITIRMPFHEDNTDQLAQTNVPNFSVDGALRKALQSLITSQAQISALLDSVGGVLLLPASIKAAMKNRLTSITGQISRVLGQLGASFASDVVILHAALQGATLINGGGQTVTSGTIKAQGKNELSVLPPVYQVGYDPTSQAAIQAQLTAFVSANQITTQQAMFSANQIRQSITAAINEVNTNFGNYGYDTVVIYRGLAVSVQQATEAAIASTQQTVKIFRVVSPMSLRAVARAAGLTPEEQNFLESLNPYLPSVNYLPTGTEVLVPA